MILLKILAGLVKALNGSAHPMQIAGGAWIGCALGLSPFLGGHTVLLVLFLLVFRVNLGAALVFALIGKLVSLLTLPTLAVPLGRWLLEPGGSTRRIIVSLLDTPVIGLADLENHAVLGGLLIGLSLGALLFYPIMRGIVAYRVHVREGFRNSRTLRWLSRTWLFRIFKGLLTGVA